MGEDTNQEPKLEESEAVIPEEEVPAEEDESGEAPQEGGAEAVLQPA